MGPNLREPIDSVRNMTDYTLDELPVVCIARQVEDGALVVQGIATPMVAGGLVLAKLTHAPDVYCASAIGQALCPGWASLGVARGALWIGQTNQPSPPGADSLQNSTVVII